MASFVGEMGSGLPVLGEPVAGLAVPTEKARVRTAPAAVEVNDEPLPLVPSWRCFVGVENRLLLGRVDVVVVVNMVESPMAGAEGSFCRSAFGLGGTGGLGDVSKSGR